MQEKDILIDFARALIETPLTIILLLLDLLGLATVIIWVVDDLQEAIVVIVFVVILIASQYLVFRQIRLQLAGFEQAKPIVKFSRVRQAQMYHASAVVEGRRPTYEILQIWFINQPPLPGESSIAKDVTAKITIFNLEQVPIFEYHGQWAKSNAPDNVGYDDILDSINIPPSHLEAKLIIALKYPSDSKCYAFTREGSRSTPDGRSERYEILEGTYKIKVHLRGVGVDENFCFSFRNNGVSKSMELEQQTA